jgi:hypothetical protein
MTSFPRSFAIPRFAKKSMALEPTRSKHLWTTAGRVFLGHCSIVEGRLGRRWLKSHPAAPAKTTSIAGAYVTAGSGTQPGRQKSIPSERTLCNQRDASSTDLEDVGAPPRKSLLHPSFAPSFCQSGSVLANEAVGAAVATSAHATQVREMGMESIGQNWGTSGANGNRVMAYPPKKFYPQSAAAMEQLEDDWSNAVGLERLTEILGKEAEERGSVFVTSHSDLKDWIPQTIIVKKMAMGSSTIVEISV